MRYYYEHFLVLVEKKRFALASQSLGISQPALSKSIRLLENTLGVRLFERSSKGVALTEAGGKLYYRVNRMNNEYQKALQEIEDIKNNSRSRLNIGAGPLWESILVPLTAQLLKQYPGMEITILSNSIEGFIQALAEEKIDIALGGDDFHNTRNASGLIFIPLKLIRMVIVCHHTHPLALKVEPKELKNYPWVAFQRSEQFLRHLNAWLERHQQAGINFSLQTDLISIALDTIKRTQGLMCMADEYFTALNDPEYVTLAIQESIWSWQTGIWYNPEAPQSTAGLALIKMLITSFKSSDYARAGRNQM